MTAKSTKSSVVPQMVKEFEQLLEKPLDEINAYRSKNAKLMKELIVLVDLIRQENPKEAKRQLEESIKKHKNFLG